MAKKKHVGTFYSVDTVLYKITELETQGYGKNQICGVAAIDDLIAMLQGDAEIELHGGNGEKQVLDVLMHMGFTEQQAQAYFQEVKDGGVALFVENVQLEMNDDQIEMDSAVERGLSGEQLDGQDEQQQIIEGTVPRIDTRNL